MTWNWSWIDSTSATSRASNSIDDSGGSIYVYRVASRGPINAQEIRSSIDSISTNINHFWRLWRNNIRPILDSLPAGRRDERWRTGRGLPSKIDALTYGIQGSTLFVFNDATSSKASGRYWQSTDERPITIAEAFENVWTAIDDIDITTTTSSSTDLTPLWYAIGDRYRDSSLISVSTSLDKRTGALEDYLDQLEEDVYEPSTYSPYSYGHSLDYSIAQNLDLLLKAHGITGGWQSDPTGLGHSSFAPGAHTHPYTDISTTLSIGDTQARVAPLSYLDNDIKRLRYEIQRTRGSASWYSDPLDPVSGTTDGTLLQHMNYVGSGSQTATNPHGITYTDIGVDAFFSNIASFIGMSNYTVAESTSYTSTTYITSGQSLETAISVLDDTITNLTGFVFKRTYDVYRPSMSDTEREQSAITWSHGLGEYPASITCIDLSTTNQESWGMYSAPTVDVQIEFPDANTIKVWTACENLRIVALFGGETGGPSSLTTAYVRSIKADSAVQLNGDITLVSGANVTLSQLGNNITINASTSGISGLPNNAVLFGASDGSIDYDATNFYYTGTTCLIKSINASGGATTTITAAGSSTSNLLLTCTATSGTASIFLDSGTLIKFDDGYRSGWSQQYIKLSDSSSGWSNYRTTFGEVGILEAIYAASLTGADGSLYILKDGTRDFTGDQSHGDYHITDAKNITYGDTPTTATFSSNEIIVDWNVGRNIQYVVVDADAEDLTFSDNPPGIATDLTLIVFLDGPNGDITGVGDFTSGGDILWDDDMPTMTGLPDRYVVFNFVYDGTHYFGSIKNFSLPV